MTTEHIEIKIINGSVTKSEKSLNTEKGESKKKRGHFIEKKF